LSRRFALSDWAGYRPAPSRWGALIQRSRLKGDERAEVERAFAGVYARTETITGKPWRHPAAHMVDPEFVREWARGSGRP
jgi:hypothetical protein